MTGTADNSALVQRGFRILLPQLAGYIARELSHEYPNNWWNVVLDTLSDQIGDLPDTDDFAERVDSLDVANCLRLFDRRWNEVFRKKLSIDYRTWSKELMGIRNRLAHIGSQDFSEDDTWRALDTMARLCGAFDDEATEDIRELLRSSRYGSAGGSTQVNSTPVIQPSKPKQYSVSAEGLPSWRDIIEPHPDVAQGRYKNAEFAADLAQVSRGEGAFEYRDPVEFFARTYVTEGMSGLLVQALKRVSGKDGEPVIQLKTAFGGGKTHSMLALYHMLRASVSAEKIPSIKPVLASAGLATMPKANVAVLVGTAIEPTRSRRPANMPGITINTLWGEMAAQLAESAGDPRLYEYVKEADKKGVSPGSRTLKELFDACGPCLILMDELVAYAKKLYGAAGLPAGTFDNFITFVQEVTEAARASKNSLVVASIPESDIEIGGEAGKTALAAIEHTFGRMESIWKPVAANEGFEVVRRRLFLDCKDPDGRDMICTKFSQFYSENSSDFPIEAKEVEYRDRMISCYPIHPEIFDRLYNDWSTLERFQRTRGVLRLMAAVIHELWMGNDASAMIMPGSFPMDVQNVSYELTRHLGDDNWNAIIDGEVDGKNSLPFKHDKDNNRFGRLMASRRVARTIFLGSAPTSRNQAVRGIEASRIRLGVIQPGENIAVFNDAMSSLQSSLTYLYTDPSGNRFWYDTRPTLRKTAEERATQLSESDVEYEIEKRLKAMRREPQFAGLHICPSSSLDVPDEQAVRLVILGPRSVFKKDKRDCEAMKDIESIFSERGSGPRIYKNMLAFVVPDQANMSGLKDGVRKYLAWRSIKDDSVELNLDASQNKETDNNLARSDDTVEARIRETYQWLLVPYIDRSADIREVQWESYQISGGTDNIVIKAAKKMIDNEALINKWAPALLLMELDGLLWQEKSSICIRTLWDYLCTYCYLPRLAGFNVLEETIRDGLNSSEYFALASAVSDGRFVDLKYCQYVDTINRSDHLVKVTEAKKQIEAEKMSSLSANAEIADPHISPAADDKANTFAPSYAPGSETNTASANSGKIKDHFFMSAKLDNTRINRDVQKLVEEVIQHLTSLEGCKVDISLEVSAETPDGFSQSIIRTVSENCHALKVDNCGFED